MKWKLVPEEIDRATCRPMLDVWNRCMKNFETLEMTWPQLVAVAPPLDADIEEALRLTEEIADYETKYPEIARTPRDMETIARALLKVTGRE